MADLGAIGNLRTQVEDHVTLLSVRAACGARTESVSGIVYDNTSTPCARLVRAYRRSDGYLMDETTSNAGTGAYSLACTADEVHRVVLDDAAGTLYNDLIDRVLPG